MRQTRRHRLTITLRDQVPTVGISLPPQDGGTLIYQCRYDQQQKIDSVYHSAGGAPTPQIQWDAVAGPILRWFIREDEPFGRMQPDPFMRAESGVWDADVLIRIPSAWLALGQLPKSDPGNGGYWCDFPAMKLFRFWPVGGAGHNATLFGQMRQGQVVVRDFGTDTVKPTTKVKPDKWVSYRIRYDYPARTVGFWEHVNGVWTEIQTVTGGFDAQDIDRSESCGPIFHATTRKIGPPDGGHYPPAWVDYHSYRVIQRS